MRGPYDIISADPPWRYSDRKQGSTKFGPGSVGTYGCLKTEEICNIPVREWASPDAGLFLWATWPNLPDAMQVIEAWGFQYVTLGFIWVKTNKNLGTPFFGPGYYTKANSEPCLLAKRGNGLKPVSNRVSQVIAEDDPGEDLLVAPARVGRHSEKPKIYLDKIVELFGDRPRLEMFAREVHPGWDAWGNEISPLDALDVPCL
jgi:N6-adenosine-specific RNA methylase IME4